MCILPGFLISFLFEISTLLNLGFRLCIKYRNKQSLLEQILLNRCMKLSKTVQACRIQCVDVHITRMYRFHYFLEMLAPFNLEFQVYIEYRHKQFVSTPPLINCCMEFQGFSQAPSRSAHEYTIKFVQQNSRDLNCIMVDHTSLGRTFYVNESNGNLLSQFIT